MVVSILRYMVPVLAVSLMLEAVDPDISNLNNCINEVRLANLNPPVVPTFDIYKRNYQKLISDLQIATPSLPFVYQEAAAKPLIAYLQRMGPVQFFNLFNGSPTDALSQSLIQIIPDAVLSVLFHNTVNVQGVNAFQEVASDLYDSFISEEKRVSAQTGRPIESPTYGVIPPLVKFGNAESGPYTWPCDATMQLLGMRCPIVSLPPAQLKGGLLAWVSLGHETGGHDVLHADAGLLQELAQKVQSAVLAKFQSPLLATYWSDCIDETASDVFGLLNMGPGAGIGLIGYFRSIRDGKLASIGFKKGPHPIDLLRGHLAAAVVKRLNFKAAAVWSRILTAETNKDSLGYLQLTDPNGLLAFPTTLDVAVASVDVVAEVIMKSKLTSLQGYSLQDIQDWTNDDQAIVKTLIKSIRVNGALPANLQGPGFFAAHVVSASTLAGLRANSNISAIFNDMLAYLQTMHNQNPTWSKTPTVQALRLLENVGLNERTTDNHKPRSAISRLPEGSLTFEEANLQEDALLLAQ